MAWFSFAIPWMHRNQSGNADAGSARQQGYRNEGN
jgi:hypothetical protein